MKFLNKQAIASLAAALLLTFGYAATALAAFGIKNIGYTKDINYEACQVYFYVASPNSVCTWRISAPSTNNMLLGVDAYHRGTPKGYTVFVSLKDGNNVRIMSAANYISNYGGYWAFELNEPYSYGSTSIKYKPIKGKVYIVDAGLNFEHDKSTNKPMTSIVWGWLYLNLN